MCALFNGRKNKQEETVYHCPFCVLDSRKKLGQETVRANLSLVWSFKSPLIVPTLSGHDGDPWCTKDSAHPCVGLHRKAGMQRSFSEMSVKLSWGQIDFIRCAIWSQRNRSGCTRKRGSRRTRYFRWYTCCCCSLSPSPAGATVRRASRSTIVKP